MRQLKQPPLLIGGGRHRVSSTHGLEARLDSLRTCKDAGRRCRRTPRRGFARPAWPKSRWAANRRPGAIINIDHLLRQTGQYYYFVMEGSRSERRIRAG